MELKYDRYHNYKYRAWLVNHKFMCTPDLIDFNNMRIKFDSEWYDQDDFILMQTTNHLTLDGKEVFEDDIIAIEKNDRLIVKIIHRVDFANRFWFVDNYKAFTVLGNIHENPELLDKYNIIRPSLIFKETK